MSTTSVTARRVRLAAQIERDLLRPAIKSVQSPSCFACGRAFIKGVGRFCSIRCRAAFDACLYEAPDLDRYYSLPKGPTGFNIHCAFCQTRFDSRGLRCCSIEHERKFKEKEQLDAELAENPFRVVKPKCQECGQPMPIWKNGRRVRSDHKFCSSRCERRRAKTGGGPGGDQTPSDEEITVKKCPANGPLEGGDVAASVADRGAP
jgi:hypothetical protein